MVWVHSAARSAVIVLMVSTVCAGQVPTTPGTPATHVIKMGVNDSRSGTIGQRGDVDVYEITITRPGVFRFAVRNIPREVRFGDEIAELQMTLTATNPEGLTWSKFTTGNKAGFESEPFALPKGTYQIKIKDYFDDAASNDPYTIQTIFDQVNDPGEPNDTPAAAKPLKSGNPTKGYVLPPKDADYYKIVLTSPGRVTVTIRDIPPAIREGRGVKALYLGIMDAQERVLREFTSAARRDVLTTGEMVMNVGTYILCVRDFNGDNFSASPYTIVATYPSRKGSLTPSEKGLLASVKAQFEKSGGIDDQEAQVLKRLEARFLEDD